MSRRVGGAVLINQKKEIMKVKRNYMENRRPSRRINPADKKTSTLAVMSLVMSLVSLLLLPILGAILSIVFGHMANSEIKKSRGRMTGSGFAMTGLIIGYFSVFVWIVILLFFTGLMTAALTL